MMAPNRSDLALTLLNEWTAWYIALGPFNAPRQAFTGLDEKGRQFLVRLDHLPAGQIDHRKFMIWMCRQFKCVAYLYSSRVVLCQKDEREEELIAVDCASREQTASTYLAPVKYADSEWTFERRTIYTHSAPSQVPFLNLLTSSETISEDDELTFYDLWHQCHASIVWNCFDVNMQGSPEQPHWSSEQLFDVLEGNWVPVSRHPGVQVFIDVDSIRRVEDTLTVRGRFSTERTGYNKTALMPFREMLIQMQFNMVTKQCRTYWSTVINLNNTETNLKMRGEWQDVEYGFQGIYDFLLNRAR